MARNVSDSERSAMRRAVDTYPKDTSTWFSHARHLLAAAVEIGTPRDALLIVLQKEREVAEKLALLMGLPHMCLGECIPPQPEEAEQPLERRTGNFESDVVRTYLPEFLDKATLEEQRKNLPSFALHARDTYRDRLHQITRRESHRSQLRRDVGSDDRCHVEYTIFTGEGQPVVAAATAAMAAWVPSAAEHFQQQMVLESLREELDPLDYQVAELHMAGLIHQGDNGEIAKLLKVSPARISTARTRIRELLRRK